MSSALLRAILIYSYTNQLVSKEKGVYKVVKTIGSATERPEIEALKRKAQEVMDELKCQPSLLPSDENQQLAASISQLNNRQIQTIGPELIFGNIYDFIGFISLP